MTSDRSNHVDGEPIAAFVTPRVLTWLPDKILVIAALKSRFMFTFEIFFETKKGFFPSGTGMLEFYLKSIAASQRWLSGRPVATIVIRWKFPVAGRKSNPSFRWVHRVTITMSEYISSVWPTHSIIPFQKWFYSVRQLLFSDLTSGIIKLFMVILEINNYHLSTFNSSIIWGAEIWRTVIFLKWMGKNWSHRCYFQKLQPYIELRGKSWFRKLKILPCLTCK